MKNLTVLFSVLLCCTFIFAQTGEYDIELYKQFLLNNQNMTASQLNELHPAGEFKSTVRGSWESALYHDSLEYKYHLTADEISLIKKHGFVVTSRLREKSFGRQLLNIYHDDMPVFISTDAILHAFHSSYDRILKDVELQTLIPQLKSFLASMHDRLAELDEKYGDITNLKTMLRDVDVYITIPRKLLSPEISPLYPENIPLVNRYLYFIQEENLQSVPIFSDVERKIDFSQFKPRGHYTDPYNTQLADYFRAMIWLGRIEIYLIPPRSADQNPTFADIQRQIIDACLIREIISREELSADYLQMEEIISFFVGEQDNVTLDNLSEIFEQVSLNSAADFLDSLKVVEFQDFLQLQPYARQRILSQVLMSDPMNPDSIIPASSFLLFGQRFVIDSYVTGNVVFDRILYENEKILRLFPSTLDILFTLGNDAAAQLLISELEKYHYATNLAGLRYLISSYEQEFWDSSIYNMWLNSVRALNPPDERASLPEFMQTAAWWQEKMNTQLASWTELRHDNLLYAKQSYTGGVVCSYPYSYVEPVPAFYRNLQSAASRIKSRIQDMPFETQNFGEYIAGHFAHWESVMDTLAGIADKELTGTVLTTEEELFLKRMISEEFVCGGVYDGWYPDLFYPRWEYDEGLLKKDYLVADYHTTPTDEAGNFIGWVLHSGTGPVDMAVVTAVLPSGEQVAFIGPVASYFEYTTTNFLRLTDEEWKEDYLDRASRPDWVNIYMTDTDGKMRGTGPSLLTSTNEEPPQPLIPETFLTAVNYPNPFNNSTIIRFHIPGSLAHQQARLAIYDVRGKLIITLFDKPLPGGTYFTRWKGVDSSGHTLASGIYFYSLLVGANRFVGKMQLIK
jgi:hypothetical protein